MDILSYIENKHEKCTAVYVAIGSAAHCSRHDEQTDKWYIEPLFEQQFPKFLRDFKENFPVHPVHIILIDPMLEDPPFVVCNFKKQIDSSWIKTTRNDTEIYINETSNMYVYPIQKAIGCPGDENIDMYVNFTNFFDTLNKLSILYNWFTVVQDYSGRYMYKISEHYDKALRNHKNHIVYGLNVRLDESCCVDLLRPAGTFVYQEKSDGITVFNPYNFDNVSDMYDALLAVQHNQETTKEYQIMKDQIDIYMTEKGNILFALSDVIRQVLLFQNNAPYDKRNILSRHNARMAHIFGIEIEKMLEDKNYDELLNILYIIIQHELFQFLSFQYDNNNRTKIVDGIMADIKKEEPFKISTIIRRITYNYSKFVEKIT